MTAYYYGVPTGGGNCLTKELILDFYDSYNATSSVAVTEGERTYVMHDLCRPAGNFAPYSSQCKMRSVLQWWDYNRTRIELDDDVLATLNQTVEDYTGRSLPISSVLGSVAYDASGQT